jgi:O-antigen/teichoic acid export membrane protein
LTALALQAKRNIKTLVIFESASDLLKSSGKIAFLFMGFGLLGVVWGYVAAAGIIAILSLMLFCYLARHDELLPKLKNLFSQAVRVSFGPFLRFGILISIEKNFSTFFSILPLLFLGKFDVPAVAGFYKIAFSYIALPMVLLGGVSRLLGIQFPQSKAEGIANLKRKFVQSSLYAGLIGIALVIPAAALAPFLVTLFYGTAYLPVVKIILPLAVVMLPVGFTIGFSALYRVLGKVHIAFGINVCFLGSMVVLAVVLFSFISPLRIVLIVFAYWHYVGLVVNRLILDKFLRDAKRKEAAAM